MRTITMTEAAARFNAGNNAGLGYAPYVDAPGPDTIAEAVSCAINDGWKIVLSPSNSDEITVLRNEDGQLMAIGGDAMGRCAWAVDISDSARAEA